LCYFSGVGDPLVLRLYDRVIVSIRVGSRERLESQAREFQSYLWECLHTLNWKDTHGAYRDAYGTAALILALCESEKLDDNSGKFNVVDSIRTLDMGLLLGSRIHASNTARICIQFTKEVYDNVT